nr:hypothetical protein GCM10020063_009560 [Dactylosporangium thailandense]
MRHLACISGVVTSGVTGVIAVIAATTRYRPVAAYGRDGSASIAADGVLMTMKSPAPDAHTGSAAPQQTLECRGRTISIEPAAQRTIHRQHGCADPAGGARVVAGPRRPR